MFDFQQLVSMALAGQAVFGTVPDWAMEIVTGITAYFLYRTLQSQIKVQRTQEEMLNIELYQHYEAIKPEFDVLGCESIESKSEKRGNGKNHYFGTVSPIVTQHKYRARNVNISTSYVMGQEEPVFMESVFLNF